MKNSILVAAILFVFNLPIFAQASPINVADSEPLLLKYVMMIVVECDRYKVDTDLALSLCWNESRFKPKAYNENWRKIQGRWRLTSLDQGLFQLNSKNLKEWSTKYNNGVPIDPYDPATNVHVGIQRLSYLLKRYGPWLAICYWNAGESCGDIPEESKALAHAVLHETF